MHTSLQPATPEMAPPASALIYLTMGKMADYLFGSDNAHTAQATLMHMFREKSNRFSYQHTLVATLSGAITGMAITYPGLLMKSLQVPTAFSLLRARGIFRFVQFIKRASPLFGVTEAENDEYFISNLAVPADYQGRGIGKFLLSQIEQAARNQGYKKLSLSVDIENKRAFSLYSRIGFNVLETVKIEPLQKRIGYVGFNRMVKVLA